MTTAVINKPQVRFFMQGEPAPLTAERHSALLSALATLLNTSQPAIELRDVTNQSPTLELELPGEAVEQLRDMLANNNPNLRLMGVQGVLLERESGDLEEWRVVDGTFSMIRSSPPLAQFEAGRGRPATAPIHGIWRLHLIYLILTAAMAVSAYTHYIYISLLVVSGFCALGIIMAGFKRYYVSQAQALAIGLATPIIVFAVLEPWWALALLFSLSGAFIMLRRFLF